MHPQYTRFILFHNIHFVVGAVFGGDLPGLLYAHAALHATLLGVEVGAHVLAPVCEFIFETSFQAFIQMVVWWILRKEPLAIPLIQYLTNQYPINSNASAASEVHYTRIGITFLEKQMRVVFVYEVHLDLIHAFVYAF